ncbi:MAG: hypothetical protein HOC05_16320 [Gemmatimonadetes bacterium]|nr:hypothetical protein [Gemmatimonadota bacterium]
MSFAIINDRAALSDYLQEVFSTWGLPLCRPIAVADVDALEPVTTPVLILPAGSDVDAAVEFAARGGIVVTMLPQGAVAAAAGLQRGTDKETPLRLRVVSEPLTGLAGELLPIVGRAANFSRIDDDVRVLAYLTVPGSFDGECVGITERRIGDGLIVAFAFDLPHTLMMLRQGDPAKADVIPPGDNRHRASHLVCDLGDTDAGWIPFTDLLSRLLVDLLLRRVHLPLPLFDHLPDGASGIVLYSGDEDRADVSANDTEFETVTAAGGRMNLYIIPENTQSSPADTARYRQHHDLGPHVDLVPHADKSIDERLAEFERQVNLFREKFQVTPLTARNHNLMWVGYTELAELQARLGIRMESNFICGATYLRSFDTAPYSGYGAGMPMRFCRTDGQLIELFQQHFQLEDDCHFSDDIAYSTKFTPALYEAHLNRCLDDITRRFQIPYGANLHPSNWVRFSATQGETLLRRAAAYGLPIWSFDQWCTFWCARDTWTFADIQWDGVTLSFRVAGDAALPGLEVNLPEEYGGATLGDVAIDGVPVTTTAVSRFGTMRAQIRLPDGVAEAGVTARYRS